MAETNTVKDVRADFAESVAKTLIEQLKQGTAPWQKPWSPADGDDLPYNPLSGSTYSGINQLSLLMENRSDPRWLTFNQAKAANLHVRKGEKGVRIMAVMRDQVRVKRDDNGKIIKDSQGNSVKERIQLDRPIVKMFTVFNAEQIEGMDPLPPREAKKYEWQPHEKAEAILKASGADITHKAGDQAYYSPRRDQIVLPERQQFATQDGYYATALHELGHWTGHESRLNRDLSHVFGSEGYAREELRAEISSMMISREIGVPHDPSAHASYVASWIKVLEENPQEILSAATDAKKIRDFVTGLEASRELGQEVLPAKPDPEKVIDALAANHGWTKESATFARKDIGDGIPSEQNPEGKNIVSAMFDTSGRNIAMDSGYATVFELNCEGKDAATIAQVFNEGVKEYQTFQMVDRQALNESLQAQSSLTSEYEATRALPDYMIHPDVQLGCLLSESGLRFDNARITAVNEDKNQVILTSRMATPNGDKIMTLSLDPTTLRADIQRAQDSGLRRHPEPWQINQDPAPGQSARLDAARENYQNALISASADEKRVSAVRSGIMEELLEHIRPDQRVTARAGFYESEAIRLSPQQEFTQPRPEQTQTVLFSAEEPLEAER